MKVKCEGQAAPPPSTSPQWLISMTIADPDVTFDPDDTYVCTRDLWHCLNPYTS